MRDLYIGFDVAMLWAGQIGTHVNRIVHYEFASARVYTEPGTFVG